MMGFIRIVYMLAVSMLPLYPVPATWGIIVIAFLNELMPCLSQCDESWGCSGISCDSRLCCCLVEWCDGNGAVVY